MSVTFVVICFSILLVLDQNGRKRKTRSYSRAGVNTLVGHTPWEKTWRLFPSSLGRYIYMKINITR
jgi:hypothetical protein